jgi:transcriptional regulator with XRE-family HTH domain
MKTLNTQKIQERLNSLGLSPAKLSQEISVSREAVSQWLNNETFPRPDKLLKLGRLLSLKYDELVVTPEIMEPIVAFRSVRNTVTTPKHIKRAKEMGYSLEQLVEYLPFKVEINPKSLNNPVVEYKYIQTAVKAVKELLGISKIKIEVSDIINYFTQSKTILIPVLLGKEKNHENALHIHLPQSATNWVYVNLDTYELDFKFWLVHELGHIFTPQLKDDEAEEFADNFAGAFLFPEEIAKTIYQTVSELSNVNQKVNLIFENARRYTISAITVLMEINKYARENKLPEIDLGQNFYARNANFTKENYTLVSKNIFGSKKPTVSKYITISAREYQTEFFDVLARYISGKEASSSIVRNVLNLPIADSIEIFDYLKNAT